MLLLLGELSAALGCLAAAQTSAEPATEATAPDSLTLITLIRGFARAISTEPNGQTHQVYVPAGLAL